MRAEAQTAAGLVLSPTPVTVTEGGNGSYTVALAEQPSDTVTVTIRGITASGRSGNRAWLPPHFNLDTTSLMFTTSDWSTPQTVTFSIGEDNDIATNWSVRVEHTAAGGGYDSVTADQQVWIRDNDAPVQGTATITAFAAEVLEGEPAIFIVHLDPAPTSRLEVQIRTVLAGNHFSFLVSGVNRTIFAGQSSVALSVATEDDNVREADGSVRGQLGQQSLNGYIIGSPGSATVVVKDDDGGGTVLPAVSISGGAAVTEGGTARFTVTATPPPTGDLTVGLFVGGNGDFVAPDDQGRKEVTVGTSGSATYTVDTVDDDADEANGLVRVLLGSGEDYRVGTPSAATVVVNDDDDPGTVVLSPTSLGVAEGDDAEYTVRLSSRPTAEVTVAITGTASTDLTLDAASLTFTTSTWNTVQTVTVTAGEDDDAVNDAATLLHTASGGNYGSVTESLGVTVTDDDTAGLTLSTTTLGVAEGADAEYTVRLATQPTATVTVTITGTASTDLSLDATSLTFTTSTWNTAQTVTVSAAEDIDAANDAATLLHTASGGDYAGETAEVAVTVTDDDTPGTVVLSPTALGVAEGADAEYTVRLSSRPTAEVTVAVTGTAGTDLTLDAASLTFTTSTWNTVQTVTVSAAEDDDAVNDAATLLHTASGGNYGSVTGSLGVTVTDDDTAGLTLSTATLGVAEGDDAEYTVRLATQPTATVTVAITGTASTDLSLDSTSLTFTTATWSTVQTVTVTAGEDIDAANDAATLLHTASGGDYAGETAEVAVTVTDDDTPGTVVLSPTSLGVAEGGDEEYTVRLSSQPTAEVTVAVTGQASTDLTLDAASLTFTTSTWNTVQTVTVSAAEDDDAVNDAATLTHTASGGNYGSVTGSLGVTVTDDDTAELTLSTATLGVVEGDDAEYTVRLATQPTATVTVTVTGQAGTDLTLSAASLTFTTSTWSTAQTVTVSAAEDIDAANDAATLLHTASGGDYAGETAEVAVTVTDDDTPGTVVLSPTALGVAEGADAEYTVRLSSRPTAEVTVAVTGTAGTDLTLDAASLTFTTSTWNSVQTVTVSAAEDDDAVNDAATLLHTASGGNYGSVTGSLGVTVTDDDTAELTLSTATLGVAEGDDAEYTVRLATQPTATVTVTVTGQAGTDLTLSAASLTFTTSTWSTAQTVTVSAAEDIDAANDAATLLHTASGGDYAGETAEVAVTVTDDDTPGTVVLSPTTLGVAEGGDAEYTVRLSSQPTAEVTVAITGQASTDLTLDAASLTFTTSTWNTVQTVTVSAAEDDDAVNDAVTLLHTASGGNYGSVTESLGVTVTDDDTAELTLSTATLGVAEGGDAEYTVRLATQPTAQVTVAITGTASTDLSLDATSLTFTTSTWSTAQTVTVSAAEDIDAANDAATLLHTASGGDYAGETAEVAVTVTDDDTPGTVVLSPTTLGVAEGGDAEYTVRLSSQPTAEVTVAITGTASTDLTLDAASLTFTTVTWNTAQTVTVSAAQDDDAVNDAATLLHTASGGNYGSVTGSLGVTVTDDDTAGLTLSTATLGVAEGDDAEYTVRLATQPTATVTVTVTGQASTDLTLSAASLTFTTSTWSTAQTVTVSAAEDIDAANDAATLLHTASGGDYAGETAEVAVTVTDDDTPGTVVLSPTTLGVAEGGDAEYTVRLSSRPTAEVTVAVTGQAGTDLTLDAASLTFTTSTWNTVQTVTVSAAEDDDAVNDAATLLHTASGGNYGSVTGSLGVTVTDDDTAGLTLSTATLGVAEGDDAEYTVRLATQPTATVTVAITGTASTDLSLDSTSLTFTTATWSTVQTVTVTAGEDIDAANDAATLLHTASGGDYAGETAEVAVTVTDDDTPGTVVLSPTALGVAEGGDAEYTVRLSSRPTAEVTVAVTGQAGTDLTLDAASLTFTTSTWNTVQTVTVSAAEDDDAVNDAATLLHTASGGNYGSVTGSLGVTVTDDDTAGLTLSTTTLGVAEGDDAEYTVRLATQPTAEVTVAITGTASTDLSLDATSLTFTTSTWNTAQTVTVSAAEDIDAANDAATLLHTASGGDYAGETAEVAVTVTDDETAGLTLSTTTLGVAEGADAEYTVRLASQPTATVTVAISGTASTDLTLDATSLTFTTSTWNTAQTVTVSAAEDDDAVNDTATLLHTASGGDYAGETAEVAVTVTDDDTADLTLSTTALGVTEGDDAEYTVRLATEPTATVTVAVTGQASTDLSLDATSLTFTTSTWNTAQTVTVSAAEDDDAVNDTAALLHTASGGDYAGETAEVSVTVTDDESVGLTLSTTALGVTEGDDAEYTVRLATQPSATVTVAITGQASTDLTLSAASLTFTTSTWNTAQTVTVSAAEDDDAVNDTATLLHTASGGDYAGETAEVAVTVTDDESVGLTLSTTALGVTEGDDAEYTVRLATEPTATVTVAVTGQASTDLTLSAASLTFTTSTWNTAQTVTVSAGEDDDAVNDAATLLHTASGGDYAGETAEVSVTVTDDESVGLTLSTTALGVTEGDDAEYTVRLATEPTATVTVAVTGQASTDLTLDATSLTFTTSTWNTAQTVTVSAAEDDDAVNDTAALLHTASGGDYAGETAEVSVTVTDDESVGLTLSTTALGVTEGDDAEYTVRLATEPTATVTVAVTGQASTDLTLDATSLTFTTSTWNTAQTVTVSAAEDDDAVNDTAALLHTASGGDYAGETAEVSVTVTDDESVGLTLSTTALGVTEGNDAEYTVRLATQPTATVTVAITGTASTDLTLDATSLTFTTSTWNTAQTVTVSAAEDDDADNDAATLLHTASGGDYAGETASVSVTVTDDESVGLTLSTTALGVAEGDDAEYTVRLATEPTATVTVAVTGQASTDLTLDATSLTFTTSTWNTAQTVTVSAAEDDDAVNDTATLLHTASGGDYAGETAEVAVTVTDDESVGIALSTTALGVAEGDDAEYTVRLATQPSATVTVAITGTASTDLTLDATSLTFTTSTWNTAQTVTVSAGEDDDADNDTATLLHTASGGDYAGETASVSVTVTDDESVGLTLSTTALGVAEGDAAEYTVRLATEPTATVTVAITGQASTDLTLDATSLTFTTSTWNTAQTVTVSAAEDDDADNDTATLLHTASGGDYAGETASVSVTVTDDESVGLTLSTTALGIAEGDDAEYTVRLATQPSATVTVAITGQAATDLTVSAASLTFTTSTWNTAQTVTVSAAEDDDADNDTATLVHTASGGDYAGETAELAVTTTDDESVGIVLSTTALGVAEGDDAEYTVRLATQPSATVTVAITGTSGTDLMLDPASASLTFTTSTWNTAQTVTVSAAEDDDADNDAATLLHTASGGDYGSVTADLAVTVDDGDGDPVSGEVVLSVSPSSVSEGDGTTSVTVTATLSAGARGEPRVVTVTVAEDADEYAATPAVFEIEIPEDAARAAGAFDLAPVDDADDEPDQRVPITGTTEVGLAVQDTSVMLRDDDEPNRPPTFPETSYTFDLPENVSGRDAAVALGTVAARDADGDRLRYALSAGDGDRFTVSRDGGEVSYVGGGEDFESGPSQFDLQVTATDGQSETKAQVTVRVVDAPEAPEARDDRAETPEDTPLVIDVLSNDTDADGERLRAASVTAPENGTATVVSGGVRYAPDLNWYGEDRFTYTAADPGGLSSTATVRVTVTPANDPPEARDDRAETPEDTPLVIDVLSNDTDADGERLRAASVTAPENGTATVVSGGVRYAPDLNWYGEDRFTYTAADPGGLSSTATVRVTVTPANDPPEARDDRAEMPEDTPLVIDVLSNDTDADGERLRVASVTAPENGTATVVSGGVRYAPALNWYGEDRFTYTAADPGGLSSEATVRVTVTPVNDPPEAVDDAAETLEDAAVVVDVLANDTDMDGDPLTVVSAGPAAHGATAIASGGVRYSPALNWSGTDRFSYTIADPGGLTATATVTMTVLPVNDAPAGVGVIPDQMIEEGGGPVTVDLTPYFTDVDGDALGYAAVSSDESAVTVAVAGATLTLSPFVAGTATVTATASDPDGLTAVQTFGVSVGDVLVREVLTDMLAALGRAHLSSARTAIGRRLEYDDGATRLMIAGQQLTPDAWEQMGAGGLEQSHWLSLRAAALRHGRSSRDLSGSSADPRFQRSGLMGGGFGGGAGTDWGRMLLGTDVLLSFGGRGGMETPGAGVGRWRVWGQGDRQSFQWGAEDAAGYEGDLATGYLGVDVQLSEHLLAGAAVSRSGGGGDWRQGYSSGRLGTELTVLHPYVRIGGRDTAVWAQAGVGGGTAENVRALDGRRGTSPLDLRLGLLEGRHRLGRAAGGVELALRGEASWARLRTGGGETVDALAASVRRLRTGVEATLPLGVPGGVQFAPFGAVSTRHDGGAGQTGLGLETAAGVRVSGGRVRIEAQGRRLLLHTASGYEEHGFSVTAMVGGGHDEPGLTASVRPHWGAPGYGAESLWQDHVRSYTAGSDRGDGGVDARVGYGLRLPGGRLLTPLVGYGRIRDSRRVQLGARLGVPGRFNGDLSTPVEVEFLGERYARPGGGADHRVGLYGIVNFGAPSARRAPPR